MARQLLSVFVKNGYGNLQKQQQTINTDKLKYNLHLQNLKQSDTEVSTAIQIILNSHLEIRSKNKLINIITQLEYLLIEESDNDLKQQKYQSLANMLTTVTSNNTQKDKKNAIEAFLTQMARPSTQTRKEVEAKLIILAFLLILGVGMLIFGVLVPMIPITLGLTLLGFTGAVLGTAAFTIEFLLSCTSLALFGYLTLKTIEFISEPLNAYSQKNSSEYEAALRMHKHLRFFINEPKVSDSGDMQLEDTVSNLTNIPSELYLSHSL